jgi:hypothetical protein
MKNYTYKNLTIFLTVYFLIFIGLLFNHYQDIQVKNDSQKRNSHEIILKVYNRHIQYLFIRLSKLM